MKYKISTFLLFGITIILCFAYFKQRQEISKLNEQSKVIGKTDTVYIKKPFKLESPFNTVVLPKYIFLYGQTNDISKSHESKLVSSQDNTVQREDSLIQVILDREDLFLSFKNSIDSSYLKLDYKLNLDEFKYNWVGGKMTVQKIGSKLKFIPYTYIKYRPIHTMADLGLGISFKTRNIQYKLGLNWFYYHCLQNKLGTDLEFSITYNLSK